MLVKILDAEPEFVEALKSATGARTAAKAYVQAAERYHANVDRIATLNQTVQDLRLEVSRLRGVIEGARSSASLLLEQVSQGDLLS
ncbi:hypothetical protein [Pseudomonas amygdali]|uniref:hypothetical protein n=1 Tax=Pseudomonas amygdali TaxID=47877 RepID=UPI0039670C10